MGSTKYIGIVGWNPSTELLARTYHFDVKGTEVLALASPNPEAQKFAREVLGLKHIFSDPYHLFELHQLNAICVESSGELHFTEVAKALDAGTDVLIHLPLASNVSDCKDIEKEVRSHPSQKALLSLARRFDPALKQIKNQLKEGRLGNLISINLENYEALPDNFHEHAFSVSKGIFMDLTLEDVDLVRWLTEQEFTSVFARGSAEKYPSLKKNNDADTAFISASMVNGILVNFLSSRTGVTGDGFSFHIIGTKGELRYQSHNAAIQIHTEGIETPIKHMSDHSNYLRLLKFFAGTIGTSERLPYKLTDGTEATKVAVAMTKSYLLGQVVNVDE